VGRACSTYARGTKYKILFVKPEWKTLLGKPRRRWEKIRMGMDIGWNV
jgi:hypothetical protein